MALDRRELFLGGCVLLLFVTAMVRILTPQPPTWRSLSVEGLSISSQPIAQGQTVVAEQSMAAPDDVYVVGWSYRIQGWEAMPELRLNAGKTTLFVGTRGGNLEMSPAFFPAGSGFLVRRGDPITLQLRVTNTGPAGQTRGADALVYFVPVR
jgi:hypothetical protein